MSKKVKLVDLYNGNEDMSEVELYDICIPIKEKIGIAEKLSNACIKIEDGKLIVDNIAKMITLEMTALVIYTNIEIDKELTNLDGYDMISQLRIDLSEKCNDYNKLCELVDIYFNDVLTNNSVDNINRAILYKANNVVNNLADKLVKNIDKLDTDVISAYLYKLLSKLSDEENNKKE